jgi:hypothetical protein
VGGVRQFDAGGARMEVAGHAENVRQKLFSRAAVTIVVVAGLAWLAISLICLGMGFESSEYEKSDERWWHDMYSCVPVWVAFVSFTGASAISLHCRKNGIALFVALISLGAIWAWFPGPGRVLVAAISMAVIGVSTASFVFRRH